MLKASPSICRGTARVRRATTSRRGERGGVRREDLGMRREDLGERRGVYRTGAAARSAWRTASALRPNLNGGALAQAHAIREAPEAEGLVMRR